ncbi:hypothetical protein [Kingella potus]|uniref:hypothetical protein n=1 Tax=Kingella potus TaxID=265175 RepID=UPI001FD2A001|nr:hypothetical protein [Kingella potus]UOP00310.1 hypothetical protein LVJ84_10430 [Kingella potus]
MDDSDLEEDVVFFDSTDTPAAADNASFDLDLSALDIPQAGIASSAVTNDEETLSRQNVDWDSIESTESIFEPDEPVPAKPQPAAAKPSAPAQKEESVSSWATGDAFTLHEKQRAAEKAQAARAPEPEPVVSWAGSAAFAEPKAAEPVKAAEPAKTPVPKAAEPTRSAEPKPAESVLETHTEHLPEVEPLSWGEDIAAMPVSEAAAEPAAQIQTASAAEEVLADFDFTPVAEIPAQAAAKTAEPEPQPVFDETEVPLAFEPVAETPVADIPAAPIEEMQTASVETEAAPLDFDFTPDAPATAEADSYRCQTAGIFPRRGNCRAAFGIYRRRYCRQHS